MRTITLTNKYGQPVHSRRVSNEVFNTTTHARVENNRIVALHADSAPTGMESAYPVVEGVVRLPHGGGEPTTLRGALAVARWSVTLERENSCEEVDAVAYVLTRSGDTIIVTAPAGGGRIRHQRVAGWITQGHEIDRCDVPCVL